MLCSTNDTAVKNTWLHLGFTHCNEEQMKEWNIASTDLVHLANTTQMHKLVPPKRRYRSVITAHGRGHTHTWILTLTYSRAKSHVQAVNGETWQVLPMSHTQFNTFSHTQNVHYSG
jgi:hypothetical protein